MHFLGELFAEYPFISALQTAFMIWMAVDAYLRRADFFWYWIIFFVPVLGAWVYFFVVLAPHLASEKNYFAHLFQRKVSLDELRYKAEQAPTLANNLALGQRLIAKGAIDEALPVLQAAHKVEPEHGSVLFALAQCHAQKGKPDDAVLHLQRIIQRDPRWSDYEAWRLLIDVHREAGKNEAALEKARELVHIAPSLQHKCVLSEILIEQDVADEARALLERAILDHAYTPAALRRHNNRWVKQAKKLLKRT